jgi:hypothetical protein
MTLASASLLISGLAVLVSCFAATVSWRAYRRSGARVEANLRIMEPSHTADEGVIIAGSVELSISNKGLAAIGVNHAIWIIERSETTLVSVMTPDGRIAPMDGPELPMTLSGLHSASWSLDFDKLVDQVESGYAKVHVIFSLGDREISTPRRYLPGKDSVTIQG